MDGSIYFNSTIVYVIVSSGASLSTAGCLVIIMTYLFMHDLQRHPYTIVYRIALSDLVTSVSLLIAHGLAFLTESKDVNNNDVVFFIFFLLASIGEFMSLSFHILLSISLLINSISPFANGGVLNKFFKPIYFFCVVYPVLRVTVWRYYLYKGDLHLSRKSELPWEGAIGISLTFLLDVTALVMSFCSVRALDNRLYKTKRRILIQMALYLMVFIICYSGPLVFRIEYLISKQAESSSNPLFYWSEISAIFIGFFNSLVWIAMPNIRNSIQKRFLVCHHAHDVEKGKLLEKKGDDIGQLYLLLRKNLLVITLQGIRAIMRTYAQKNLIIQNSTKLEVGYIDFDEVAVDLNGDTNLENGSVDDDDLLMGEALMTSLAPKAFINIAKISGFSTKYLDETLLPSTFLQDALKNQKFSEGKSGSFFVFSPDKRLIIKTIPDHEYKSMKRLLPRYYEHLMKYPDSLLVRILGTYSVTFVQTKVYILVMSNLFTMPIHEKYDLKGSWVSRKASPSSSVKKDEDFKRSVNIAGSVDRLLELIQVDSTLLRDHNIMDYSLLLGFQKLDSKTSLKYRSNPKEQQMTVQDIALREMIDSSEEEIISNGSITSSDGSEMYVMGIIDILQEFNFMKKVEHVAKVYFKCNDKLGLSAVDPNYYQKRFFARMENILRNEKKVSFFGVDD